MGERPGSRIPPARGMRGVMSGDERGAAVTEGETAGSMLGEVTIAALRGAGGGDAALRAETSEEERLLGCRSMCVGAVPRWRRWWESCVLWSRTRRPARRCSSRTKPWNRFFSTHLPMFTARHVSAT